MAYAKKHEGEPAESGAVYGLGGTPAGYGTISTLMSGVLEAMYEPAPEPPS